MESIGVSRGDKYSAIKFGEQLAKLHQTHADTFGWYRDNTIGSTPQVNKQNKNWIAFYREHRLQYQISLAIHKGCGIELQDLGERLCDRLDAFFASYQPKPSLLHGDLWSGNYAYDENSNPVLFDPAVYYGDREADIAMTELFGGFSTDFYYTYSDTYPMDDGYEVRKTLYNLYHILNHLNLFGGGYYQQSIGMMKNLLSEIG
jgi:fructosamine-3-kinase